MKIPIEDVKKDGLEVIVHQQDDDSDAFAEDCEFNSCTKTLAVTGLTPSYDRAHLEVVRCTLAQPKQVNDWRRTVILQTCTKIENKSCKVIVNSDSCINVVASKLITTLEMKPVKHPNPTRSRGSTLHPYMFKRYQILIQFGTDTDNLCCEISL